MCAAVALAPDHAVATDCDPDDPSKCAAPITKGQPAPFSGQLLTTTLAIDLGLRADECQARTDLEVDFVKRAAALDLKLEKDLRANDQTGHKLELEVVQADRDRWKELASVPFYEHPWFVASITAVVVSGIFIGSARLIQVAVPVQ